MTPYRTKHLFDKVASSVVMSGVLLFDSSPAPHMPTFDMRHELFGFRILPQASHSPSSSNARVHVDILAWKAHGVKSVATNAAELGGYYVHNPSCATSPPMMPEVHRPRQGKAICWTAMLCRFMLARAKTTLHFSRHLRLGSSRPKQSPTLRSGCLFFRGTIF